MRVPVLAAALLALCSCGSIMQPGPDMIPVSTEPEGAQVFVGKNPHPVAVTPATISIDRVGAGSEYLGFWEGRGIRIKLVHDGCHPQDVMVHEVLNGWYFGNLLLGGVIGMLVDLASGNSTKWSEDALHVKLTPLSEPAPAALDASKALALQPKPRDPEKEPIW